MQRFKINRSEAGIELEGGVSSFYCREEELRKMNSRYENGRFECLVIYGRRRVGKTALINEFCRDKPTVFFSALNTTDRENLEVFSKAIMAYERQEEADCPTFPTFDSALNELTMLTKDKRVVVVIDEYPYLAKATKNATFSSHPTTLSTFSPNTAAAFPPKQPHPPTSL